MRAPTTQAPSPIQKKVSHAPRPPFPAQSPLDINACSTRASRPRSSRLRSSRATIPPIPTRRLKRPSADPLSPVIFRFNVHSGFQSSHSSVIQPAGLESQSHWSPIDDTFGVLLAGASKQTQPRILGRDNAVAHRHGRRPRACSNCKKLHIRCKGALLHGEKCEACVAKSTDCSFASSSDLQF
ncbi:Zn(2)-C6 fungal-type DNA-binding domain protein [Akanthomyces lecanii RCEF 1005]|uniref:Zn(2)-C6 fungal-type DNA-binding domain protein n=1 Tax=Akanthomyces lecanii RCEF 1005 TaxID=1081108 RepID=A0A167XL05_CORDF|nr:Zn(2)-C6 fungal-type DNA-binding domain protein [Akanthomyces lecanii RCEF 1005]